MFYVIRIMKADVRHKMVHLAFFYVERGSVDKSNIIISNTVLWILSNHLPSFKINAIRVTAVKSTYKQKVGHIGIITLYIDKIGSNIVIKAKLKSITEILCHDYVVFIALLSVVLYTLLFKAGNVKQS